MRVTLLLLLVGFVVAMSDVGIAAEDPIVHARANDPELLAARREAQARLGEFFRVTIPPAPGTRYHAAKIPLRQDGKTEWVWVTDLTRVTQDRYSGRISNTPVGVKGYAKDQGIEFPVTDIADWTYEEGGRYQGGWSLCVFARRDVKFAERIAAEGYQCR